MVRSHTATVPTTSDKTRVVKSKHCASTYADNSHVHIDIHRVLIYTLSKQTIKNILTCKISDLQCLVKTTQF